MYSNFFKNINQKQFIIVNYIIIFNIKFKENVIKFKMC
jgi:hypothetical protein